MRRATWPAGIVLIVLLATSACGSSDDTTDSTASASKPAASGLTTLLPKDIQDAGTTFVDRFSV
ncbi:hypothetical protein GCM10009556_035280 [Acrocarpospora pleiomorpha]|uniref:hypothetical protein n=1 Tax=Acrocarpospora pleiomorpha TaxID=90975 RepID=UPI0031DF1528